MASTGRTSSNGLSWSFQIGWVVFVVATWSVVAVLFDPRLLRKVGADGLSAWLLAHAWVRWVAAPIWFPFLFLSVCTPISSRKAPRSADPEDEAGLPESDPIDPILGVRQGDPLLWRFGPHQVEAGAWRARGDRTFVARGTIRIGSPLAFQARSARAEPAWMRGIAQKAMQAGLSKVDASRPDQEETLKAMGFLGEDPVALGMDPLSGMLVLRADDPARARELFARSDVVRAVKELERNRSRWSLSLLPEGEPGALGLRFECPGGAGRAEHAHDLVMAVLGWLEASAPESAG